MSDTIKYMSIGFFLVLIYKLFYGIADHSSSITIFNQNQNQRSISLESFIIYSDEVKDAIARGLPLIALESTIISHGMPYPQNYKTALEVEDIVRSNGAIPATIALINGTIRVGLDKESLHHLSSVGKAAIKTSRRDLALVLAQPDRTGSTTVSATIFIANLVGIKLFVTGGLGGVHRGAEESFDISADLTELGKNEITVVSAGVKSILDIGKTLEYLETQGVTVITLGSDYFPSFFTPKSEFKTPNRLDSYLECAKVIDANHRLQLNSGIVITVPNIFPSTVDFDQSISQAVKEAETLKVAGKEITPFLLKRVNELTGGKSLESNIHLIKENAKVGALIAVELSKLKNSNNNQQTTTSQNKEVTATTTTTTTRKQSVISVVGGAVIDLISHPNNALQMKTSNPGVMNIKVGGVGKNVAEIISRLQLETLFISMVGDDVQSNIIYDHFRSVNISTDGVKRVSGSSTATYNAIMNEVGDLEVAISIMDIFKKITPDYIAQFKEEIRKSKMIVFDANIPLETMVSLAALAKESAIPMFFEPTSVPKSSIPMLSSEKAGVDIIPMITYSSPNVDELLEMSKKVCLRVSNSKKVEQLCREVDKSNHKDKSVQSIELHSNILLEAGMQTLFVKFGKSGVFVMSLNKETNDNALVSQHFDAPNIKDEELVDVTGAGDSMVGCIIWSIINNQTLQQSMAIGTKCAAASLISTDPVSPLVNLNYILSK
ncbi:hypothetical protein PPL_03743 [Heterostelium album PN500]|uniref:Carbohydrate kinase PfkB domain-containing protein n=1 Tax=Heterostelium pallidum (strain ATCC 26659 / Pp 5 / PN500) TaxID=670386 RepID=D3B6J5_HETP5|nr:hypothetical protein PPL_03743 [Heterostelium album PN500]EFA82965.1 hypothetical protein PPL_03743 [Heterostelium album PN500]|eukprot:XP_020435082.1 hypothetical protein PPL_03743 [Heterostelium album PN500]